MAAIRSSGPDSRRLLAIEDDAAVIRHWKRLLTGRAQIVAAPSFDAAWRATDPDVWRDHPFDYVFLDLRLPDGNGGDVLDRLHDLEPRPAVAVISAFLDAHNAVAIHGRCAIAVPKPADREVLLAVLGILEEARFGRSLVEDFAAKHGLSPQETRLLLAAVRDASNEEAAAELGCTHATVRSYWRRIFEKTGRSSAREVTNLLFHFASSPMPRAQTATPCTQQGDITARRTPSSLRSWGDVSIPPVGMRTIVQRKARQP